MGCRCRCRPDCFPLVQKKKVGKESVRRLGWSPDIEKRLGVALMTDRDEIRQDIECGKLDLMEWDGELLTVTEIQGSTFVICCIAGRGVVRHMASLYQLAQQSGCDTARFHSHRPGIARVARVYGFERTGTDNHGQAVYMCRVD